MRSGFLLPDLNFLPEPVGPFGPLARILLGLPEACRRLTALQLSLLVEHPEDLELCLLGDVPLEGDLGGIDALLFGADDHHPCRYFFGVVCVCEPGPYRIATRIHGDVRYSRDSFDESIALLARPPSRSHVDTVCVSVRTHTVLAGLTVLAHAHLSVQIVNAQTL